MYAAMKRRTRDREKGEFGHKGPCGREFGHKDHFGLCGRTQHDDGLQYDTFLI